MANSSLQRSRTAGSTKTKFTMSMWVKKSANNAKYLLVNYTDDSNRGLIQFGGSDEFLFQSRYSNSINASIQTNRKFRDLSAWYHFVLIGDSTLATAGDRLKLYVNGVRETSFASNTQISQNGDFYLNEATTNGFRVGEKGDGSDFFDGYISHFVFLDGVAAAYTEFGETDSTSGIWKFKTPSGLTFGTNGVHLKFENSGNLGLDSSGNTNNMSVNGNLKQSIDTPSNNYCTLNPNDVVKQSGGIYKPTFSNANLTMSSPDNANRQTFGTIAPETGKWYWEFKVDVANTTGHRLGIFFSNDKTHSGSYYYGTNAFYIHQNGEIYYNGSSTTYMSSYTAGDIISVALDITNGNLYFSKNGGASDSTWADGSGNNNQAFPGTSVNGKLSASWISGPVTPFFDVYGNGCKQSINFGNGLFGTTAISSAGSNGNNSLFEYDVPSGYYALNTKNINTYG